MQGRPKSVYGSTAELPNIPVPGEVFRLKKLLPQTPEYDFNIHIMDFDPGEYLNVKVMPMPPFVFCGVHSQLETNFDLCTPKPVG